MTRGHHRQVMTLPWRFVSSFHRTCSRTFSVEVRELVPPNLPENLLPRASHSTMNLPRPCRSNRDSCQLTFTCTVHCRGESWVRKSGVRSSLDQSPDGSITKGCDDRSRIWVRCVLREEKILAISLGGLGGSACGGVQIRGATMASDVLSFNTVIDNRDINTLSPRESASEIRAPCENQDENQRERTKIRRTKIRHPV